MLDVERLGVYSTALRLVESNERPATTANKFSVLILAANRTDTIY